MCVNSNIFLNRILGREKKLSKVLECTLPFHTLKASILNPGIIFLCVRWHVHNITSLWRNLLFHVIWSYAWVHVIDFHAVGNGHTCDDNHPHVPCMHTGRNPGKPLPWVGMSLSPVSVGTVMSGMAWQGDMSGDSVGWNIFVMLIMQGILKPPESTVDRVLCQ